MRRSTSRGSGLDTSNLDSQLRTTVHASPPPASPISHSAPVRSELYDRLDETLNPDAEPIQQHNTGDVGPTDTLTLEDSNQQIPPQRHTRWEQSAPVLVRGGNERLATSMSHPMRTEGFSLPDTPIVLPQRKREKIPKDQRDAPTSFKTTAYAFKRNPYAALGPRDQLKDSGGWKGRVSGYCTAASYNSTDLLSYFQKKVIKADSLFGGDRSAAPRLIREVIHISQRNNSTDIFVFPYGCVVFWNTTRNEEKDFLHRVKKFCDKPVHAVEYDDFEFSFGDKTRIVGDEFVLETNDLMTKLSFSHAIAQSTKLSLFEDNISKLIKQTKHLPEELQKTGHISLSSKETSQLIGELFIERNNINLHSDILDVPEFFWERTALEVYYREAAAYLDIRQRVEVLNARTAVVQQLFDMLRGEQQHHSANRLEAVVMWLVLAEVVLEILAILVEIFSSKIQSLFK